MIKYFYSKGMDNFGPFTIDELKEKGITRETMVWFQGLGEWKKADTVQELNDLFALIPPPIQQQNAYNQQVLSQANSNNTIDLFVLLSIAYWFSMSLANFVIQKVVDDWYNKPALFFQIGTNIVFSVIPIVFALSVRNRTFKTIAIIISGLLSVILLSSNFVWLFSELK